MSLIRPELAKTLHLWREALIGGAVALLGLYWFLDTLGLLRWIGIVVLLVGGFIAWQGVQRARIPAVGDGPGVVEVDERQVSYFGPGGGAVISIDALVRVEFDTRTGRAWRLHSDGAPPLVVPADAMGADALFDALSPLPGLAKETAIRAARGDAQGLFVIWQRHRTRLH